MNMNPSEKSTSLLRGSRSTLILVAAFTLVNLVLLFTDVNLSFTFSAFTPQLFLLLSMIYPIGFFIVLTVLSVLCTVGLFVLGYFLSKKHRGWILTCAIIFTLDTAVLLYYVFLGLSEQSFDTSMLINLVFHAFVLFSLFRGVKADLVRSPSPVPVNTFSATGQNYMQEEPLPQTLIDPPQTPLE